MAHVLPDGCWGGLVLSVPTLNSSDRRRQRPHMARCLLVPPAGGFRRFRPRVEQAATPEVGALVPVAPGSRRFEEGGNSNSQSQFQDMRRVHVPLQRLTSGTREDGKVMLLLLAFNDSAESRDRLCVAASTNGGEDWTKIMTVRAGPPKNFAYPDILVLNRQEVAVSFSDNSSGGGTRSGGPAASRGLRLATFNVKEACLKANMQLDFQYSR